MTKWVNNPLYEAKDFEGVAKEMSYDLLTGINSITNADFVSWCLAEEGTEGYAGYIEECAKMTAKELYKAIMNRELMSTNHPMQKHDKQKFVPHLPISHDALAKYMREVLKIELIYKVEYNNIREE